MKAVVQRVSRATLSIDGKPHAKIGRGVVVLLGVGPEDSEVEARKLAAKVIASRIHADADNKMNLALADAGGEALIVSQFTLFADTRKGNRPSYTGAAPPEHAIPLYELFVAECEALLPGRIRTGVFAADMQIELINDGPVTICMDTAEWSAKT
ncbi:MAG: D-aminoacyl-tRNA deacylase [bacterium]|nr:D-aminoacyl-tRNA deacylase [bacterium]